MIFMFSKLTVRNISHVFYKFFHQKHVMWVFHYWQSIIDASNIDLCQCFAVCVARGKTIQTKSATLSILHPTVNSYMHHTVTTGRPSGGPAFNSTGLYCCNFGVCSLTFTTTIVISIGSLVKISLVSCSEQVMVILILSRIDT